MGLSLLQKVHPVCNTREASIRELSHLSLEATVIEKALLLRARLAPENRIAVREAAEPRDDVAVAFGVGEVFVAQLTA